MYKFSMKANLLAGVTHTINILTPQQKTVADESDPVNANKMVLKIVSECEGFNNDFMMATKATSEKLTAAFDSKKAELDEESKGMNDLDKSKLAAVKTNDYRKMAEEINKESEAKPDVMVECQLSDEKMNALKKLMRLVTVSWTDSALYVEAADAIDGAVEVK
jgi:predicted  nucleic acid-binding Zn-ribbon protein